MDHAICTIDTVCGNQIFLCPPPKVRQRNKKSIWDVLNRLAETIGEFMLEVLRSNNAPEPVFSNGGTRVLIRPDRIDLI